MQFPFFKEHMIAYAVWYHLERGVDISEIVRKERNTCRNCGIEPCPFRDMLGTKMKEYNKIKPYLDALGSAGLITYDYKWIKGNGHTKKEAAYAAHNLTDILY